MGKKDRARKAAKQKKQQQAAAAKAKAKSPTGNPSPQSVARGGGSKARVVKQVAQEKKEQPPLVLGFQVGNTNSRVAYQADEHPDLIAAECGSRLIKSFVTFEVRVRCPKFEVCEAREKMWETKCLIAYCRSSRLTSHLPELTTTLSA